MKNLLTVILLLTFVVISSSVARAHCQIPCGIYDDPARFTEMREHVTTIEKSMVLIEALSAAEDKNMNQIVRWVINKENHADELTEIVTFYFQAQRVKPADPTDEEAFKEYTDQLVLLHQITYNTMKAKQTTNLEYIETLRKLIDDFETLYLGEPAEHAHTHADGDTHTH